MRANNDVLLLTWSVLSKEDPDSLEDHKDRKWPFEKVPDVETASLSMYFDLELTFDLLLLNAYD